MPEKMYVLMVTWREVTMPALLPATQTFEARVELTVHPAGVSTSAKKLKERAEKLREEFYPSFEGYQIIEVQVIDDVN